MQEFYYQQPRMTLQFPKITWAVQRLILINAALFALQLLVRPLEIWLALRWNSADISIAHWFGFQPGYFIVGYFWKPFTYQFLHGGLMHLFMNMLWLYVFGPDVERTLGSRQFIRFYVACGALGVLATIGPYLLSGVYATVIGASGAAMGVLVAFAMIDPDRQFFLFPLPMPITASWLVFLVVLFNIVALRVGDSGVSVATHFGGMIAGAGLMKAIPIYHHWRRNKERTAGGAGPEKKFNRSASERNGKVGEAVDNIFRFKDPL